MALGITDSLFPSYLILTLLWSELMKVFEFENCTPILNLIHTRAKTSFKAGLLKKVKNEFLYRIVAPETDGCQPQI